MSGENSEEARKLYEEDKFKYFQVQFANSTNYINDRVEKVKRDVKEDLEKLENKLEDKFNERWTDLELKLMTEMEELKADLKSTKKEMEQKVNKVKGDIPPKERTMKDRTASREVVLSRINEWYDKENGTYREIANHYFRMNKYSCYDEKKMVFAGNLGRRHMNPEEVDPKFLKIRVLFVTQKLKDEIIEEALERGDLGKTIRSGKTWEERQDQREYKRLMEQCNKRNEEEQKAGVDKNQGNERSSGSGGSNLMWRVKRSGRNGQPYEMTKDAKRDRDRPIRFKTKEPEEAKETEEIGENIYPAGADTLILGGTPPPTQTQTQ